ncbi:MULTISPECIES: phenylalanine--tRNA ligase subunit alpha [unclassified Archaeoglobus]|jgi:phenylalanyl-tRNA synthetase alpha chain|uniref:phenylalanine--tRNA ligase subunit alpha n=1 Tax=unclassified Archaeoglobus TaxID=2643606 RepID=UPI0025B83553|nr:MULTISPECIES: phenylalanine--tRNA ligase subunit alpha [unclassified Archaeoglobus]
MLSKIEVILLKSLEAGRSYTPEEASELSGMNKDAVLKAAYLLQEKGYVRVVEKSETEYRLTKEGEKYLKEGLPEEKLVHLVKSGVDNIDELRKTIGKEFQIGLGWLRKKGVAEVKDDKIRLLKEPDFREKEVLRAIKEGEVIEVDKVLERRKLVEKHESKQVFIEVIKKPDIAVQELITDLTPEMLLNGSWKGKEFLKYDISIPSKEIYGGKIHPYERIIEECRKVFLEMGFTEIKGHYVQPAFWNFDALFQPQDHPARDMQDTFYLDRYVELEEDVVERVKKTHENGWKTGSTGWGGQWSLRKAKQLVLRTHTTAITIHYLAENPEPPQKAFCIDRVYRRETIDATHLPEFDQLEGVVLDRDVGFRHLLGLLREFFTKMGFEDVRFRPGYFPYTEPSVEPEVYVEGLGWVELGGAGVFRKEVTEPLGIKGKVLAWGLGIGRLAMLKIGLKDLRRLYLPDLGWLRSMPVVRK